MNIYSHIYVSRVNLMRVLLMSQNVYIILIRYVLVTNSATFQFSINFRSN